MSIYSFGISDLYNNLTKTLKGGTLVKNKQELDNELWHLMYELVETVLPGADMDDLPAATERALKKLKGLCKIEVVMTLELSNYVHKGKHFVLRSALPNTDPESWPSQWAKIHESDITDDVGEDWRDAIEEA